jgi:DUF438 domain-containing protein
MKPFEIIKKEHVILKKKIKLLRKNFNNYQNRKNLSDLLNDFEAFWSQHEEKEERFFNWFLDHGGEFPFHKTMIREHEQLKGHWKVLMDFLKNKEDQKLKIALETDGNMILDKFIKHIQKEDNYFKNKFNDDSLTSDYL